MYISKYTLKSFNKVKHSAQTDLCESFYFISRIDYGTFNELK